MGTMKTAEYKEDRRTKLSILRKFVDVATEAQRLFNKDTPISPLDRDIIERKYTVKQITWNEGKSIWTARLITTCGTEKIISRGYYTKDNEKTTLAAVRGSLDRLHNEEYLVEDTKEKLAYKSLGKTWGELTKKARGILLSIATATDTNIGDVAKNGSLALIEFKGTFVAVDGKVDKNGKIVVDENSKLHLTEDVDVVWTNRRLYVFDY